MNYIQKFNVNGKNIDIANTNFDIQTLDTSSFDLDITDSSDNILVRFANGHIQTKNFYSKTIIDSLDTNINNETNYFSGMIINCLGDSITYGYTGGTPSRANPTWCEQIATNLNCTVNNYGVSATSVCNGSSESFVTRLNNMTETNIDLLLIFGGTNDYGDNRATTLGTIDDEATQGTNFYASYKYLIESAIQKYPYAMIATITPMRRSSYTANKYGITIENIADAIVEISRYYSIPCYDFFHNGGLNPQISIHKTTWTSDGLHPNQAGINKWIAPQFTEFCSILLKYKSSNN